MCGTCPARWLSFKSRYELVIRANIANNVENLRDQQYRAVQLRLQISGEPECWLNQAEQSGETWVASWDAIIEHFDKRFVTADGIEMAIRHFEDAHQEVSEDLGAFMSRLRRLAGYAFAMEGEDSRLSRVIWKFVTGLHDECVRRDVIRHKWIGEEGPAKEYDVIVSTAQDALRVIRAKEISGPSVSTVKEDVLMAAVQDLSKSVCCLPRKTTVDLVPSNVAGVLAIVGSHSAHYSVGIVAGAPWRLSQLLSTRAGVPDLGTHTKTSSDVDVSSKS